MEPGGSIPGDRPVGRTGTDGDRADLPPGAWVEVVAGFLLVPALHALVGTLFVALFVAVGPGAVVSAPFAIWLGCMGVVQVAYVGPVFVGFLPVRHRVALGIALGAGLTALANGCLMASAFNP